MLIPSDPTLMHESDIAEIADSTLKATGPMPWAGKRVLLTGATGFLGRYFTAAFTEINLALAGLSERPVEVIALDNGQTSKPSLSNVDQHITFVKHDVTQPFQVEDHIDYVLAAAGIASPSQYKRFPLQTIDVAVYGLRHALGIARAHQSKLVFFSSSEIYGDPDPRYVPTPESYRGHVSCTGERACYDESKRIGETLCQVYHQQYGVNARTVRPFNVYGPGMSKTDGRVVPSFFDRALHGQALKVYGSGEQTRTFCYVTDAIRGFLQALVQGSPGEPYNIGNPFPEVTMSTLAACVLEACPGSSSRIDTVEPPPGYLDEPGRRCPDISKATLHLGFTPVVPLVEGLTRFAAWARRAY